MKQVSLSGSLRENVGRNGSVELRRKERVPGVVYGSRRQIHFSVAINDLDKIIRQPDTLQINLEVNGETIPSIMQEIQWHPTTDKPIHFDLLELIPGKPVKTALPVKAVGTSEGVRSGGKLVQNYRKMKIIGLPEHLPDSITVDITPLKIGDNVRVRDLSYPNCELLEAEASVVIGVQVTRAAAAEEKVAAAAPAAAAAAPAAAGADAKKK